MRKKEKGIKKLKEGKDGVKLKSTYNFLWIVTIDPDGLNGMKVGGKMSI